MMFTNDVKTYWPLHKPREQVLLEDISFFDEEGLEWKAPAGSTINGADIPTFFWRIIGSPFVGHFRYASVIHDVYCKTKSRPHKDVHRMFNEAMRHSGVPKWKRAAMAKAVLWFGPKW